MRFGTALTLFVPKSVGADLLAGARRGVGAESARSTSQQHLLQLLQMPSWARPAGSRLAPALHPLVDLSSVAARRRRAARSFVARVVDIADPAHSHISHVP